jgi:hypothetical protein
MGATQLRIKLEDNIKWILKVCACGLNLLTLRIQQPVVDDTEHSKEYYVSMKKSNFYDLIINYEYWDCFLKVSDPWN